MLLPETVRKALNKLADVDDCHAHSAFQQLVGGELFQRTIGQKLRGNVDLGKHLTENDLILCSIDGNPPADFNHAAGWKRRVDQIDIGLQQILQPVFNAVQHQQ